MQLKKKEMVLIVITVILVIILCIGFYYDRNSALLDRTNVLAVSQDPNVKLANAGRYVGKDRFMALNEMARRLANR